MQVLHCEKPGTGCNDAPRCFSLKLAQVTRNLCGLRPSTVDGELCMKHVAEAGRSKLVVIMTKPVDDLKLAGARAEVTSVLQQIEKSVWQAVQKILEKISNKCWLVSGLVVVFHAQIFRRATVR